MDKNGYLLGIDVGSSSIKCSLVSVSTGQTMTAAQSPMEEMKMLSVQTGWAEQDPELWWTHVTIAVKQCVKQAEIKPEAILAIGIAYQMHGLVLVDKQLTALRPSIIWCDSRAVEIGAHAFDELGHDYCLKNLLP